MGRLTTRRPARCVPRPGLVMVDALAVPDLPAGVTGDWPGSPRPCANVQAVPLRWGLRSGSWADGDATPRALRVRAIPAQLCPASRSAKIHCTWGRGVQIGVEQLQPPSPLRVGGVGMRTGIDEPVTIRWAAAEVSALQPGLSVHGGGAPPGTQNLAPGLVTGIISNARCVGSPRSTGPSNSGIHTPTPKALSCAMIVWAWPWPKPRSNSPITTASNARSGWAAASSSAEAWGRSCQGRVREQAVSKNSTVMCSLPPMTPAANSSCHSREEIGSWNRAVEIRP